MGCTKPQRWGKKYSDKRSWVEYNERLVRRGEFYIAMDFLHCWEEDIREMNRGKRGRPFEYPDAFIRFSAVLYHVFPLPYCQLEGVLRSLSRYLEKLKSANYTTLFRRITSLKISMNDVMKVMDDVVIVVDSTGIKVKNRGE